MNPNVTIAERIAAVSTDEQFALMARQTFEFQYQNNAAFARFVREVHGENTFDIDRPPFLPVELFKHQRISCHSTEATTFYSSGTSATQRSAHPVYDLGLYEQLSIQHFKALYGNLKEVCILALLPSYLENGDSSLVFMVDRFVKRGHPSSGFVLHQPEKLHAQLLSLKEKGQHTILFGVSYALLDFAELRTVDFPELTIMETGGMKGRRKEMTRDELHAAIRKGFPGSPIHSEYGMTELLSQGYMMDGKHFLPPSWMRAFSTEISDPLRVLEHGRRGLLAFVDLANYHSCSFIQTKDIGYVNADGSFVVEGRLDHSDLRGCNLLYT